jgi:ABC-type glycerol-3-phosphate transport system permease component
MIRSITIQKLFTNLRKEEQHFSARRFVTNLLLYLAMAVIVFVFLLPFVWMILTSFKPTAEVFQYTYPLTWKTFLPPHPTLENYKEILVTWGFHRYLGNTLLVASLQMVGSCIFSSMAGFAFSRIKFRGRDLLFAITMMTAFVPMDVIIVPLYSVMKSLHLVSTYTALFLPNIFTPFGIFLMRQAFFEIPNQLDEAATIEGASIFQVFWHVVLPNSRPALITLALIQFMFSWNNFIWPLVIMQNPEKQVIQVALANFRTIANFPLFGELFAGATLATVPILILFFALQKYFIRGMLMSGMK